MPENRPASASQRQLFQTESGTKRPSWRRSRPRRGGLTPGGVSGCSAGGFTGGGTVTDRVSFLTGTLNVSLLKEEDADREHHDHIQRDVHRVQVMKRQVIDAPLLHEL